MYLSKHWCVDEEVLVKLNPQALYCNPWKIYRQYVLNAAQSHRHETKMKRLLKGHAIYAED